MIADPLFLLAATAAILIVGISKGGFAGGVGIVGVPLMALVIPPLQAAAIMLPILIVMDVIGLWAYRGKWDIPNLKILAPAAVIGIAIGWLLAEVVEDHHVRLAIGAIAVAFALNYWIGSSADKPPRQRSILRGGFWGAVAGFTSFVAHAGGPPYSVYMLPQRLHKTAYVGTSVLFFALINWTKLPPYIALGQFDEETLWAALILMPLAPIGMVLGIWLHKIIPEQPFYRVCYAAILVVGLKLLWDGVTASLAII